MGLYSAATAFTATRRPRRGSRRARALALATAAALSPLAVAESAAAADRGASPSRTRQPFIAQGAGAVTGELRLCFNGAPGPCGWVVEGTSAGTPIASGTFFAAIDDQNAATAGRCAPAAYSGVLQQSPDDGSAHAANGKICPDGSGGFVFAGRLDDASGFGRLDAVSAARGVVLDAIAADGSATFTLADHTRVEQGSS